MATITSSIISTPVDSETVLTSALWTTEFNALYANDVNQNMQLNFQHTAAGQHEFSDGETLDDDAGAELIKFSVAATAVNELTIGNAATGNAPSCAATGDDTNIGVELTPKGSGRVTDGGVNIPNISSTDTLTNKSIDATTNTITGLVSSDVGLGNVDNTSDATKNAATATLTNKTINADSNTITNIGSTEIKEEMITGQTIVTPASGDNILLIDKTDGTFKKANIAPLLLAGSGDMLLATYDPAGITEQVVGAVSNQTVAGDKTFTGTMAMTSKPMNQAKGSDLASAATVNIGAGTGNFIHITGTTTITAFDTVQAGTDRTVIFDGILTLTHNATSLILPTGANITTAANDTAIFRSEGSGNWRCISYERADGTALAITIDPEVYEAIKTAVTTNPASSARTTYKIEFPYKFSDGNTWASITGESCNGTVGQGWTGLTSTNVYWMGVYIDLTAAYSSTVAPVTGDIDIRLSGSNITEPTAIANYMKIGTYLPVTATSATAVNFIEGFYSSEKWFEQRSNRVLFTGLTSGSTVSSYLIANAVSPLATKVEFSHNLNFTINAAVEKDYSYAAYFFSSGLSNANSYVSFIRSGRTLSTGVVNNRTSLTLPVIGQSIGFHLDTGSLAAHTVNKHQVEINSFREN